MEQIRFDGPRSFKLNARMWRTELEPKGSIFGTHGYSEHSGRYFHVAEFWNSKAYNFAMLDLPGHGLSEGRRANIDDFQDYVRSMEAFYEKLRELVMDPPSFLFGHSLGGLVGIRFLQTSKYASQVDRAFLSSPLLGLSSHAFHGVGGLTHNPLGRKLLQTIVSFLPNFTLNNKRDLAGSILTHDPEITIQRHKDQLVCPQVTMNWTREAMNAIELAFKNEQKIEVPLAIFQSGDDRVVSEEAAENFIKQLSIKDKLYKAYPKLFHEILNEIEREEVFQDMLSWLQRSKPKAEASSIAQ